jgi:hypothetical protein
MAATFQENVLAGETGHLFLKGHRCWFSITWQMAYQD